jgi:putative DNA primase/helicase
LLTEDLPEHIPVGDDDFVIEVIKFIKVYTSKSRDLIDNGSEHLINLKNGLFNLQTENLEKHRPNIYSIRQIPVAYSPTATCPNINKFLVDIEISKQDVKVLLEFAGYSLIPDTKIQKALMLFVDGANGKSIWLKFITNWIGDKNISGMGLQKLETDKFAVSNLYGKLLNIYPDLKDQAVYHSDMFKTLVGGDRIIDEKKYKDPFRFYNPARLMFFANKIPEIKERGYLVFRRWILIHFPKKFVEGKNDDKSIFTKLITEEEKLGFFNLVLPHLKNVLAEMRFSYDLDINIILLSHLTLLYDVFSL